MIFICRHVTNSAMLLLLPMLALSGAVCALEKNGFEIRRPLVPRDEIVQGGPPRDGIPALDEPDSVEAGDARFLKPDDRILGISLRGAARAYPIRILNYHEVVNDRIGTEPVVITYCPLCGSGMAFSSEVGGRLLTFGVSGLLYNSDVLLFDRQTESLWSQLRKQAVTGPLKGQELEMLPVAHTAWRHLTATPMRTPLVVVGDIRCDEALQMQNAENESVIQALGPNRSHPPFCDGIGSRSFRGCTNLCHAKRSDATIDRCAVTAVAVMD
jgi:hypothetical protein